MDRLILNIEDFPLMPNVVNIHKLLKIVGHAFFVVSYRVLEDVDGYKPCAIRLHNRQTEYEYYVEANIPVTMDVEDELVELLIENITSVKN